MEKENLRKPMTAGNRIEYIEKNGNDGLPRLGKYVVIATGVRMMASGRWVDAVVYAKPGHLGSDWRVMETDEFYETFKNEGEDLNGNDTD